MVEAVLFDVGNTLLRDDPSVPELFTMVARRMGHDVTVADVMPCMPEVSEFYERQYRIDGDFWCSHERAVRLWLDMYTMMARSCGIDEGVGDLAQAVYDEYLDPRNWSFFKDAEACLGELKARGLALGIVSNWDASLEGLIRGKCQPGLFEAVVASGAVGYRKPDPAIFQIAFERLGVAPENTVHVGDLPEADGEGATAAGAIPVIIDRAERFPDCPYARIASLEQLPALIDAGFTGCR